MEAKDLLKIGVFEVLEMWNTKAPVIRITMDTVRIVQMETTIKNGFEELRYLPWMSSVEFFWILSKPLLLLLVEVVVDLRVDVL